MINVEVPVQRRKIIGISLLQNLSVAFSTKKPILNQHVIVANLDYCGGKWEIYLSRVIFASAATASLQRLVIRNSFCIALHH